MAILSPTEMLEQIKEDYSDVVSPAERLEQMSVRNHYACIRYRDALKPIVCLSTEDELEKQFLAHYSVPFSPIAMNGRDNNDFVTAMEQVDGRISEILIGTAANAEDITPEEIRQQCILSFRQARQTAFYEILREDPTLMSRIGPRVVKIAAQYDQDFHTIFIHQQSANRLNTTDPRSLQDLLVETHKTTKLRPLRSASYTPALLDEINERLATYTSTPVLLSKMAAHATRTLQNRHRKDLNENVAMLSTPDLMAPSDPQVKRTNSKIFADLLPSDQTAINEFGLAFDDALNVVIEKHHAAFRRALSTKDKPERRPPKDIATSLAQPYMANFLRAFLDFRLLDSQGSPVGVPLFAAHGLAISELFNDEILRKKPAQDLNALLNEKTAKDFDEKEKVPMDAYKAAATAWIQQNRPEKKSHFL